MTKSIRWTELALALLLATACAASTSRQEGAAGPAARGRDIAALDRAIERERDASLLPALLFERAHTYLDRAEAVRPVRSADGTVASGGRAFARLLLDALRDFDDIANHFPDSAEAPEALFHLGVIYDYPNISSFGIALDYYHRTIAKYPGTEAARKAMSAIARIESFMHEVGQGRHGAP